MEVIDLESVSRTNHSSYTLILAISLDSAKARSTIGIDVPFLGLYLLPMSHSRIVKEHERL